MTVAQLCKEIEGRLDRMKRGTTVDIQQVGYLTRLLAIVRVQQRALKRVMSTKGLEGFAGVKENIADEALRKADEIAGSDK